MEQSAKYAYKIYEEKSFSAAAKSLFISQPALSQSITRLEKELGFAIFDRKTTPLSLTPEGAIYIDSLKEIIESERIMKERIKKLSGMEYGRVSAGGSCLVAYHILAAASAEFHKAYPDIYIKLDMGNKGDHTYLLENIKKHSLDLLIGHRFSEREHVKIPILEERYVIAMTKECAKNHGILEFSITAEELISKSYSKEKEIENTSIFKDVEFIPIVPGSTTAVKTKALLGYYLPSKCSCRNARHAGMRYNLMRCGLGATVTSDVIVRMCHSISDDVVFFVPKSEESKQFLYIAYDATQNLTAAAQNFLSITKELCESGKLFK